MLEAYALNDEIWIEPNDSRQKGIFLKITKIGRLYIHSFMAAARPKKPNFSKCLTGYL